MLFRSDCDAVNRIAGVHRVDRSDKLETRVGMHRITNGCAHTTAGANHTNTNLLRT